MTLKQLKDKTCLPSMTLNNHIVNNVFEFSTRWQQLSLSVRVTVDSHLFFYVFLVFLLSWGRADRHKKVFFERNEWVVYSEQLLNIFNRQLSTCPVCTPPLVLWVARLYHYQTTNTSKSAQEFIKNYLQLSPLGIVHMPCAIRNRLYF